jgi:branched-chain amino acid transport system substrate-binding protein
MKNWDYLMKRAPSIMFLLLSIAALCVSTACTPQSVTIAFTADLGSGSSELGNSARRACELALRDSVQSKPSKAITVNIVEYNDRGRMEQSIENFKAILDSEAIAVIGPFTSSMAQAAYGVFGKGSLPVISPTVSTVDLYLDGDAFFPLPPTNVSNGQYLAAQAAELGFRQVSIVYDVENRSYARPLVEAFMFEFRSRGGQVPIRLAIAPEQLPLHVNDISRSPTDAILCVMNAEDTSSLASLLLESKQTLPLLLPPWAMTQGLPELIGAYGRYTLVAGTWNPSGESEEDIAFIQRYRQTWGEAPDFAAMYTYSAVRELYEILQSLRRPTRERLLAEYQKRYDERQKAAKNIHQIYIIRDGSYVLLNP